VHDFHKSVHDFHKSVHDFHKSAHDFHKSAHDFHKSVHDFHKSAHDFHKSAHDFHKSVHDFHKSVHDFPDARIMWVHNLAQKETCDDPVPCSGSGGIPSGAGRRAPSLTLSRSDLELKTRVSAKV